MGGEKEVVVDRVGTGERETMKGGNIEERNGMLGAGTEGISGKGRGNRREETERRVMGDSCQTSRVYEASLLGEVGREWSSRAHEIGDGG